MDAIYGAWNLLRFIWNDFSASFAGSIERMTRI